MKLLQQTKQLARFEHPISGNLQHLSRLPALTAKTRVLNPLGSSRLETFYETLRKAPRVQIPNTSPKTSS